MEEITNNTKEVQRIALGILKYVDKVCRENNIKYSLAGGTLLGAIRHKGFIPWDDDIDLMMLRPDYEKFLKIMDEDAKTNKKYKALHYSDNCPNYFYRFAKVVDLDTCVSESTLIVPKDMGVFVDIFPVDGIDIKNPHKPILKTLFYARMLAHSAMLKVNKKDVKLSKYLVKKFIIYPYAKLWGPKHWMKKHENYIKKFDVDKFDNSISYSGCYRERDIIPRKDFNEYIELTFEGQKFLTIKNYEPYLVSLYGDYMKLPPVEQQVSHHDLKIYKK